MSDAAMQEELEMETRGEQNASKAGEESGEASDGNKEEQAADDVPITIAEDDGDDAPGEASADQDKDNEQGKDGGEEESDEEAEEGEDVKLQINEGEVDGDESGDEGDEDVDVEAMEEELKKRKEEKVKRKEERAEKKKEKKQEKKKRARFAMEEKEEEAKAEGMAEVEEFDRTMAKKDVKKRTTTMGRVRQTIAEVAGELSNTVVDASSLPIANSIEDVLVAIRRYGTSVSGDWGAVADLTLCEAFMLLWQNEKSGSIEGRKTSTRLQAILYGCALGDLIHLEKIDLQKLNKKAMGITWDRFIVHPTGPEVMDTFLDEMFIPIAEKHDSGLRLSLSHLIEKVATSLSEGKFIVDVVIMQLVEREIIKENRHNVFGKCLYKTFPTHESSKVKQELVDRLRAVLLDGQKPTLFDQLVLRFAQMANKDFMFKNPFTSSLLKSSVEKSKGAAVLEACMNLKGEREEASNA